MSIETAKAFRDKINATPKLQAQIQQAAQTNAADILKLGAEYGFAFTEAEWYQASYPNDKDILGSFELDRMSGKRD